MIFCVDENDDDDDTLHKLAIYKLLNHAQFQENIFLLLHLSEKKRLNQEKNTQQTRRYIVFDYVKHIYVFIVSCRCR